MAIWEWMLEAYGRPGVANACETLQDTYRQNPPLLLWAVWAETADQEVLAQAADVAHRWDGVTLTPLRALRRALKAPIAPIDDDARETLRGEIKTVELQAERLLIETLSDLRKGHGGAHTLDALEAASAAWGKPAPGDALATLAAALR
jgi:uncharacterized protein (TIGR02444 family)